MFEVYIFCGGKCGGTTLAETCYKNGYKTTHLHSLTCKGMFNSNIDLSNKMNIFNIIDESSKYYDNIYVIDSYRTPIERKISSFFQNISIHLPNYNELKVEELIEFFNTNLLYNLEEYHSINNIMTHYNIKKFDSFDFSNKYNVIKKDNIIFIKILFSDIKNWNIILSQIFGKKIILQEANLTKNKEIKNLYNDFKEKYKVPIKYINNKLVNDEEFKIYNTKEQQEKYITKWINKSYK